MRTLLLSDTHGQHEFLAINHRYDIAIHTGDFSNGSEASTDRFLAWFSELDCEHKLLIAGNHDWFPFRNPDEFSDKCHRLGITYLCDSSVTINGIEFYGTPWVPQFYDWAFMEYEPKLLEIYSSIPPTTQVLLTHGPALGVLDRVSRGNVGSSALARILPTLPALQYHFFGHIHEGAGIHKTPNLISINAACMTGTYQLTKPTYRTLRITNDTRKIV